MTESVGNKWKGIQTNFCIFQGEITKVEERSGYAFLTLRTSYVKKSEKNSQFIEVPQDVPLMVEPDGPVAVIEKHVKVGRKLQAWCHFKTWETQGNSYHSFVVRKIDLGDKPYEGPSTPPLPG